MLGKQSLTCLTGIEHQASLMSKFEDFKKHDRVNPFTVEEYYFLRNNLSSFPDETPRNAVLKALPSI